MKFKVLKVREGMAGFAYVDIEYGDGRKGTFGMDSKDDIVTRAKEHYKYMIKWEKEKPKAIKHAKQFEGKEFEF